MKKLLLGLLTLLVLGVAPAFADQLEKGDIEFAFRISYSELDFDGPGGDSDQQEYVATIGYMLTDHHEIGLGVGYVDFGFSDSFDFGGAYTYNFRAGQDLNPFIAAVVVGFGGDLGDVFDLGYGADLGVKAYPWEHAGVIFGVSYRELDGSDGFPDAEQIRAFGGVTLKY